MEAGQGKIFSPPQPQFPARGQDAAAAKPAVRYTALWLLGITLRVTLLAVAPLIPVIHAELKLSETAVSLLTSLPILLLSAGALVGSLLIARLGLRNAVMVGVVTVALFSAGRGVLHSDWVLFSCTLLMGLGIAVLQPSMPALVKDWFPDKVGAATAVYSNGIMVGQVLGAGLTVPLMLPLARGSWAGALALWSIPVAATALVVLTAAEPEIRADQAPARWRVDWREPRMWEIGLIMGGSSSAYFAANAFLPDYLNMLGRGDRIAPTLIAISFYQIGAPILLLAFAGRLLARRWPLAAAGAGAFLGLGAAVLRPGGAVVVAAGGAVGFCTAFILTVCLTLPAILALPEEVHIMSAGMLAIAYACATLFPLLGGLLWDATKIPALAFAPSLAAALLVVALSWAADLRPDAPRRPALPVREPRGS